MCSPTYLVNHHDVPKTQCTIYCVYVDEWLPSPTAGCAIGKQVASNDMPTEPRPAGFPGICFPAALMQGSFGWGCPPAMAMAMQLSNANLTGIPRCLCFSSILYFCTFLLFYFSAPLLLWASMQNMHCELLYILCWSGW
jgi:hypothetical protein